MATITSTSSGNFSSGATWVGGVVPGAADVAVAANGHTVAIDTDITVISFQQAGTGKFTLGNGRNVTGNVIANAGTYTSGGTIEVTCGAGESATLNGNATGGTSNVSNIAAIVISGVGTFTLNGSIEAPFLLGLPNGQSGHAVIYTNVTCTLNINGSILSGRNFRSGIQANTSSNATINVVGNITAQGGTQAYGIWHQGQFGVVNVTATTIRSIASDGSSTFPVYTVGANAVINATAVDMIGQTLVSAGASGAINATAARVVANPSAPSGGIINSGTSGVTTVTATSIEARGVASSHAINSSGTSSTVITTGTVSAAGASSHGIVSASTSSSGGVFHTGNIIDSNFGVVGIRTNFLRVSAGPSSIVHCTPGLPIGSANPRFSSDQILTVPATADVRSGVVYNTPTTLVGTLAVPSPEFVATGVPTDNTVGSAALSLTDIAALVGEQIAAAMDAAP